MEHAINYI